MATASATSDQVPTTTLLPTTTTRATTPNTSLHAGRSVSSTSGLRAGDVIAVHVNGRFGFFLDTTTVRLCRGAGVCAARAPTPNADALVVKHETERVLSADVPFGVGIGTFRAVDGTTFDCGRGSPCVLQVGATMTISVGFSASASFPLTFSSVPAPAPTTTVPPATRPLRAVRASIPAWLWALLVCLLGVTC